MLSTISRIGLKSLQIESETASICFSGAIGSQTQSNLSLKACSACCLFCISSNDKLLYPSQLSVSSKSLAYSSGLIQAFINPSCFVFGFSCCSEVGGSGCTSTLHCSSIGNVIAPHIANISFCLSNSACNPSLLSSQIELR
ncbi:MAG: hypothetical protein LBQ24_07750 [Candidatus Peribacteria bacterium]|nr:hypothetical protein [Candidatus Peribacteria bacterium]